LWYLVSAGGLRPRKGALRNPSCVKLNGPLLRQTL